jgi:hypothetical protein
MILHSSNLIYWNQILTGKSGNCNLFRGIFCCPAECCSFASPSLHVDRGVVVNTKKRIKKYQKRILKKYWRGKGVGVGEVEPTKKSIIIYSNLPINYQ